MERRPEKNYMRTQLLSVFTPNLSLRIHPPRFRDCWLLCRMHLDLPSRGYMRIKEHYPEANRYIRSTPRDGHEHPDDPHCCSERRRFGTGIESSVSISRQKVSCSSGQRKYPAYFFRLNAAAARGKRLP